MGWAEFAIAQSRVKDKSMSVRTATTAPVSSTSGVWRTDLNVSGAGYLHGIGWYMSSRAWYVRVRVTIDGGTPFELAFAGGPSDGTMTMAGQSSSSSGSINQAYLPLGTVEFRASLKVEFMNGNVTGDLLGSAITYSLV